MEYFESEFVETRSIRLEGEEIHFQVMKVHHAFGLDLAVMVIRDDWKVAWKSAEQCVDGTKNFILVGHPGIGAHHFSMFPFSPRLNLV